MAAKRDEGESVTRKVFPLAFRASVSPASIDEDKRTCELVWTTGAQVLRTDWWSGKSYLEELSVKPKHVRMDRLKSGRAPLLDSHNGYGLAGVLGVVQSARIQGGEGTAVVRFAKAEDSPEADRVFRLVKDGIIGSVSVGYRVYAQEEDAGDGEVPVRRATDWEPFEISLVPMPADAGAGVRSSDGVETNPCVISTQERRMAKPQKPVTTSISTATAARADEVPPVDVDEGAEPETVIPDAEAESPAADEARAAAEASGVLAERKRQSEIRASARALGTLGADVSALAEQFVKEGKSVSAFRAAALKKAEQDKEPIVSDHRIQAVPGGDAHEKWVRGSSAWLIQRAGVGGSIAEAAKRRGERVELDPGEFRGMSLLEMARQSLELAGIRTAGWDAEKVFGAALVQRGGGYMATGDFATALENVTHKTLLADYLITPDTWSRFCAIGSVTDFRAHNRYRMGTFGSLPIVVEGAEYTNMVLADATKETITAKKKGAMVGISREALINDDMGIFSRTAAMVGRSAKLTVERDVYALLALAAGLGPVMADALTLFHATHANISTGAALSAAAVEADRVLMGSQLDPSSNEVLDLRPAILLVPLGLEAQAKSINEAQYDPDTANKLQKPNTSRGLFSDIVGTARLSGTRRYIFAAPSVAPTIEVAFLMGRQEPSLEMQDGWRTDGVEWKVRLEYAVGAVDWRGAVTNAGT